MREVDGGIAPSTSITNRRQGYAAYVSFGRDMRNAMHPLLSPEELQAQRRFRDQQEAEDRRHAETLRVMKQSRTAAHVAAAAAVVSATAALLTLFVVVLF